MLVSPVKGDSHFGRTRLFHLWGQIKPLIAIRMQALSDSRQIQNNPVPCRAEPGCSDLSAFRQGGRSLRLPPALYGRSISGGGCYLTHRACVSPLRRASHGGCRGQQVSPLSKRTTRERSLPGGEPLSVRYPSRCAGQYSFIRRTVSSSSSFPRFSSPFTTASRLAPFMFWPNLNLADRSSTSIRITATPRIWLT